MAFRPDMSLQHFWTTSYCFQQVGQSGVGVGLLMGLTNGSLIAYGKVPPIIVTLGMLNIIRSLLFQLLGGGGFPVYPLPSG